MPDYYTNDQPATAFSSGLMSGFSFVEGIRNARAQRDMEQQKLALAKNEDARQAAQAQRQQESFDISKSDHALALQRQNELDAAHAFASTAIAAGGLDKVTPQQRAQLVGVMREADPSYKGLSDEAVFSAGVQNAYKYEDRLAQSQQVLQQQADNTSTLTDLLGQIRGRNTSGVGAPPAPAPATPGTPPAATPAATAASAPNPVATAARPTFRGRAAPATPEDLQALQSDAASAVNAAQLSLDQARAAPGRQGGRYGQVAPANITAAQKGLDSARNLLTRANARLADPQASAGQKLAAQTQAQGAAADIATHVTNTLPAAGVAVGERAADALTTAVQAHAAAPGPKTTTASGLTAMTTFTQNLKSGSTRVTPQQVQMLAKSVAHGLISFDDAQNFVKYGQYSKPEKPTMTPLGDGTAFFVGPDGNYGIVQYGDGKGKGKNGESAAQDRLTTNDRLEQIRAGFSETYGKDQVQTNTNQFLETLKREAPTLQLHTGVPLIDPQSGALNIGQADPGEVSYLMRLYSGAQDHNAGRWYTLWNLFGKDRTLADQALTEQQNGAPPPAVAAGGGGWSITPVQ